MSDIRLIPVDRQRHVIDGLELPSPPPARIYISGHLYRIAAPQISLPPLINTIKLIWRWVGPGARKAANIMFAQGTGGTAATSDVAVLRSVANQVMSSIASGPLLSSVHSTWTLQSVTAKDNGGTSAAADSTVAALPGQATGGCNPPGTAVCISWSIAEVYRGGKPRTYLPGIPTVAVTTAGESALTSSYATALDLQATTMLTQFNTLVITGTTFKLGTVSHYSGHTVRPTPVWRSFTNARVHERIDSQRRRNGAEVLFPTTP